MADRATAWRPLIDLPLTPDAAVVARRAVNQALQSEDLQPPLPETDRLDCVVAISEVVEMAMGLLPPVVAHLMLHLRVSWDAVELRATVPNSVMQMITPLSEQFAHVWPLRLRLIHGLIDVVNLSVNGQVAVQLRKIRPR